jgi:FkbH-like protein
MDKDRILELLAETIERDVDEIRSINENTNLAEIGLDSLNFIRFIVNMEEAFGIEVYDSDLLMNYFQTIGIIFETMEKYFTAPTPLKKVLVLDCDNVLWSGIAGEEEITLNGDIIKFQAELIKLYEQGVLLCLCSKNELSNIEEAFRIPDMLLKWEHIVCAKINFNDKAANMQEIAKELNLMTDSFVFADDSYYELGLVNALLPEVDTIKIDYSDFLLIIYTIKSFFGSESSRSANRTKLYREQKEREKEKLQFDTVDEYNRSLETRYICDSANDEQIDRIAELSQRTNQFNLSGRRYTGDEIKQLMNNENYIVLALSATDKYGDMGIVGAAMIKSTETTNIIENFMISCRVFGRDFEFVLLDKAKDLSAGRDLRGIYIPSEKNQRYARFYEKNGVTLYE